jgi:uncharacterized protein (TIGR03435 family)
MKKIGEFAMATGISAKRLSCMAMSAGLLVSACSANYAQTPADKSQLQFDVASIRQAKALSGGIKPADGGDGYVVLGAPVMLMISLMYKLPPGQIEGAPEWVKSEPYDITAKADARYSTDDLHTMFKNMLAERFGLKFHWETKPGNAYVLTLDKSGSKMKVDDKPDDYQTTIMGTGKPGMLVVHRESMEHFAWWLGQTLQRDGRPVVDQTGLKGNYDFTLTALPPGLYVEPGREFPPEMRDLPSIFDALREQLGLRLTAQKAPVQYMVIDHVERPGAN